MYDKSLFKRFKTKIKGWFMNPWDPFTVSKVWEGNITVDSLIRDGKEFIEKPLIFNNKVLVGGLIKTLKWLYRQSPLTTVTSFEEDLYMGALEDDLEDGKIVAVPNGVDSIYAFNVAVDGALGGTVLPYSRHKKGYDFDFDNLVPFRVIHVSEKAGLFEALRRQYLHHRVKEYDDGERYIEFYSKPCTFSVGIYLDNEGGQLPPDPDTNLTTDLDSSGRASFPIYTDKDELIEFFQLKKAGGAESTCFSATMTMMGKPAIYTDENGIKYNALIDSCVYSRANHCVLPKGVNGTISISYNILHI